MEEALKTNSLPPTRADSPQKGRITPLENRFTTAEGQFTHGRTD
jgi:hypothetical protein